MYSLIQFRADYSSDEVCLESLFKRQNPSCCGAFYKVKGRMCYACSCGKQYYPLSGTIFEKTRTPLTSWFYVMYVMSQTRSGVSASQISRELGVKYDTAWRMMHKIRSLMKEEGKLSGHIEADETFIKPKAYRNSRVKNLPGAEGAKVLVGVAERGGGVRVKYIPSASTKYIQDFLKEAVAQGSHIHTDKATHYLATRKNGYEHTAYLHYYKVFKPGEFSFNVISGQSTQNIEGFWSQLKRGIYGVYRNVNYLQAYADEYAFRYSHRNSKVPMFELLLKRTIE